MDIDTKLDTNTVVRSVGGVWNMLTVLIVET